MLYTFQLYPGEKLRRWLQKREKWKMLLRSGVEITLWKKPWRSKTAILLKIYKVITLSSVSLHGLQKTVHDFFCQVKIWGSWGIDDQRTEKKKGFWSKQLEKAHLKNYSAKPFSKWCAYFDIPIVNTHSVLKFYFH